MSKNNNSKINIYFPILLVFTLIIGLYLGTYMSNPKSESGFFTTSDSYGGKLTQILNYIEYEYVDSVKKEALVEKAINSILEDLDPHSYYIPSKDLAAYTEPLEGNFDGIGIEFLIQYDTINVVSPIEGGPSEQLGIKAGDKIIKVDGELVAGVGISNEDVVKKLRGESGSKVNVEIKRRNKNELLPFEITRNKIPLNSLVTAQMTGENVGYIKINRFAKTTYEEFMQGAKNLEQQGMDKLILDLRGNGGGYLTTAIQMTEELLKKGQLIVYTEGKSQPKKSYYSSKTGDFSDIPLVILIDQGSASASEILAGAVQDNDRGTIVGRRSFGKGLVQEHMDLRDHSALRLTVARYFTPTGRSIQKPYGHGIDYNNDYMERMEHGELMFKDSTNFPDSLKYVTPGGKIVYGGGGIMPDVFVGLDTVGASYYLSEVTYKGVLNQFAYDYANDHRNSLSNFESYVNFNKKFTVSEKLFNDFIAYAKDEGIEPDIADIRISKDILKLRIKAFIARHIWGNDGYYAVSMKDDNVLKEALKTIDQEID